MVASNKLNAVFIASPAVANDPLILRSTPHLYCIANGYQRSPNQIAADVYPDRPATRRGTAKAPKNAAKDTRLTELGAQLKEMVKVGKLSAKDAMELYQAAAGK